MRNQRLAIPPSESPEPSFFSAQISHARRFYLDLSPRASASMAVVSGGAEHCRPDYHMHRPGFAYLSIEFVAAGEGSIVLKGKSHRLCAGDIFAYGPRIPHDIRSDRERPLVKYFVDFTGRKARRLMNSPAPGSVVQTSHPQDIRRLFDDLIAAGLRSTPFRTDICAAILEHLLLRIAETSVPLGTVGTAAFETYQRCQQFIQNHYLELRGLAEIAERCHLNASYLCRLFDRFDYESPYQYLIRLKMIYAAEQLQMAGTLVKQVAGKLGFTDPFNFSRTFTRVLGMSPNKFIELRRGTPSA
jgi:AraC-like DNA-binding protein/quercetin dioxygenase-like cupin family protein